MENFIIELKSGESYHLKTDYKRISLTNKMAIYFYIEVFSQVSRYDVKEIRKPISPIELTHCSLVITVDRKMVRMFNKS